MSIRAPKNWPRDEIINSCAIDLRQRIKNIDESAVATPEKMNSEEYEPPPRSYWPFIKAAMEKGDGEFDKLVDSLFDGTFEFPPETPEEYELRMKQRRKVCFKY